jgi:hypothetical protein
MQMLLKLYGSPNSNIFYVKLYSTNVDFPLCDYSDSIYSKFDIKYCQFALQDQRVIKHKASSWIAFKKAF